MAGSERADESVAPVSMATERTALRQGDSSHHRQGVPPDKPTLNLGARLAIGLVPSSVPAIMLVVSIGICMAIGDLPDALDSSFEQIAGGALLITYIKELFPKVMEQGDTVVNSIIASRGDGGASLKRTKAQITLLIVACISTSAVLQAAAVGFPGDPFGVSASDPHAPHESFTPAATIPYFVGFFVDGVVLAYDDTPVRCDKTLAPKLLLSLVFAIDNLLDAFGLVPVLKIAFGGNWWIMMLGFSACVLLGAVCTALLLWMLPSPTLHLVFLSLTSTSFLVGALQLISHGLSVSCMVGVAVVWVVLFVGDLVSESDEESADHGVSLQRLQHMKFSKEYDRQRSLRDLLKPGDGLKGRSEKPFAEP